MKPPFLGTRIVDDISLEDIEPLIDREALFVGRWQFRRGVDVDGWAKLKLEKAVPIYERMMAMCKAQNILTPMFVYGYFKCRRSASSLFVEGETRRFRFDFPREKKVPHRCIADLFPEGFVVFQVATVGRRVNEFAAKKFSNSAYSESFYLKGLAAEAAEATASFAHRHIREELGVSRDVGARFSPGYPSFPDLLEQRKIMKLLDPKRIGVDLTTTCMFVPEHTTSAIISVDSGATLFNPNA